jgi:membrane-associated protease RseP (regulator of RpoE activity)
MEIAQQIGFSILLVVMAFAFFNDKNRLFSG